MLNTNARAIFFFLSHTLLFLLLLVILFLFLFLSSSFSFSFISIWRTHESETETTMSTTGGRERTQAKDDCMSNLRHGDYDYVMFALVLLLHSFFAQPSSNPIRRTRLFLPYVCACMCARVLRVYIYVCVRQNTYSLAIIKHVELVLFSSFPSICLHLFHHLLT